MDRNAAMIMRKNVIGLIFVVWYANANVVRIIPLWSDPKTKSWEVLVSRNIGTALWSDFSSTGTERPGMLARATMREFTRGRYNETNAPLKTAIDLVQGNEQIFFVPVLQKVDDKAMRKARNMKKSEFTWVPASVLAGYEPVHDPRKKKSGLITIEPTFRSTFRILWPAVAQKLAEPAPKVNKA